MARAFWSKSLHIATSKTSSLIWLTASQRRTLGSFTMGTPAVVIVVFPFASLLSCVGGGAAAAVCGIITVTGAIAAISSTGS